MFKKYIKTNKLFLFISLLLFTWICCMQTLYAQKHCDMSSIIDQRESNKYTIVFKENNGLNQKQFLNKYRCALELGKHDKLKCVEEREMTGYPGAYTYYRYEQYYKGIPVQWSEIKIIEKEGELSSLHGNIVKHLNINVKPTLSEEKALSLALEHLGAEKYLWEDGEKVREMNRWSNTPGKSRYPKGHLVIKKIKWEGPKTDKNYALVYHFRIITLSPTNINTFVGEYFVSVEAHTGKIIRAHYGAVNLNDEQTVQTLYNDSQSFFVNEFSTGKYELLNNEQGYSVETKQNKTEINNYIDYFVWGIYNRVKETDGDKIWKDDDQIFPASAHWATQKTYEYFKDVHQYEGFDGAGNANIRVLVSHNNYEIYYASAKEVDGIMYLLFTDGATKEIPKYQETTWNDLGSIDNVGHEFAHGFMLKKHSSSIPDGEPFLKGKNGALHESFSDIFGALVERHTIGATGCSVFYLMGNDLTDDPVLQRSFCKPKEIGRHYDNNGTPDDYNDDIIKQGQPHTYEGKFWENPESANDDGGIHVNCAVMNYWFYLLAEGGTGKNDNGQIYNIEGIGYEEAEKLIFKYFINMFDMETDFFQAAQDIISTAKMLWPENNGCNEKTKAVAYAFYAVGMSEQPWLDECAGCNDGFKNNGEEGIDCGGPDCEECTGLLDYQYDKICNPQTGELHLEISFLDQNQVWPLSIKGDYIDEEITYAEFVNNNYKITTDIINNDNGNNFFYFFIKDAEGKYAEISGAYICNQCNDGTNSTGPEPVMMDTAM